MSSISPLPSRKPDQRLDHGEDVLFAQRAHGVRRIEVEPHVHFDAANGRKIVALGIEEDAVEQRGRDASGVGGSPGRITR